MTMEGVLAGIRVLDFSTLLPGPMATLFLAEAGAEVIKIENTETGDEMRSYVPRWGADSSNFHLLNRGKKSVALDLKSRDGQERLRKLIESADIIVEQFRPGTMARLGCSYDDVRTIKPDVIYCSVTGYGQTGPRNLRAGHDLNYQGDVGMLAVSHGPAEAPVVPAALVADIAGGTYPALVNILLALRRRDRTGEGAWLDIAMAENLFPFLYWAQGEGQVTGQWPGTGSSLVTGASSRYQLYSTADGRFLVVAALEQKFWDIFCRTIGLGLELRDDSLDPKATTARVAEIISARDSAYWAKVFHEVDCCCSLLKTLQEAMVDPQFTVRGVFSERITNGPGSEMAALPTPICREFRRRSMTLSAPRLGADTNELAPARQQAKGAWS